MIKPWISLTNNYQDHHMTQFCCIHHNTNSALKCDICYEEELNKVGSNYSYKQDV